MTLFVGSTYFLYWERKKDDFPVCLMVFERVDEALLDKVILAFPLLFLWKILLQRLDE